MSTTNTTYILNRRLTVHTCQVGTYLPVDRISCKPNPRVRIVYNIFYWFFVFTGTRGRLILIYSDRGWCVL